jgi:hypothetical protein
MAGDVLDQGNWKPRERPLSSAGTISVVVPLLLGLDRSGAGFLWRLVQRLPDGTDLRLETRHAAIFTPPVFDTARPFRVEIELEAGDDCDLFEYVLAGGPAS